MVRYRDLPTVQFAPPPSGRLELPQDAKVGDLFISPGGQVHWTYYQQRASTILAADGRPVDLRTPGGGQFRFPKVQQFLDGRWLVVESRTDPVTPNAFVFDPYGKLMQSFYAGDGIETALLDQSGDIWIGYFDEGASYRRLPHGHPSHRYGPNGLIRLNDRGEIEFAYNTHVTDKSRKFIHWINALTVEEDRAWFVPTAEFFLASVRGDQVDYVFSDFLPLGSRALSVGSSHFAFL